MGAQLQVVHQCNSTVTSSDDDTDSKVDLIDQFAKNKSTDEIVKALSKGIAKFAGLNDFSNAEKLKAKLMQIAPMAVEEIVKAAEVIEKEKMAAMDFARIKPLSQLFNSLTPGEAAAFYFELKSVTYKAHQKIFRQGECDNRLFFIESGFLKVSYFDCQLKKNIVFANLLKGDACGAEAFFTYTPHTTTLTTIEDSKVLFLEKKSFQKLKEEYPSLEHKLISYCDKNQKRVVVQNPGNQVRRAHQRYQVSLKGVLQRIDDRGNLIAQTISATASDISAGGLCLKVLNLGIGDAADYHQSKVQVTFSYQKHFITYDMTKTAKVVSVRMLPYGECSLHLQFEVPLEESKILEIAKYTNIPAYL